MENLRNNTILRIVKFLNAEVEIIEEIPSQESIKGAKIDILG